jgi:hypothetical protein
MLLKFLSQYGMKALTLITALFISGIWAYGQNLIGHSYRDIRKYMNENCRDMSFNNVTNNKFNYLKYTDSSDSQTLLFFLTQDSVCKSERLICDNGLKTEKIKEFNSLYKQGGENRWIDRHDNKDYLVEIKDEKWSFVITIERDK